MVTETTLMAWENVQEKIPTYKERVYQHISRFRCTRQSISDSTGIPINIVTPRVHELLQDEKIEVDGIDHKNREILVIK